MNTHLLLREIGLCAVGCVAASVIQVSTPLNEQAKKLFIGAIVVTTGLIMARVGGLI